MRVSVIDPPNPVVSWDEARAHLRLDEGDDQKAYVEGLVAVATAWLDAPDGWLGRALGDQVLEAQFPALTVASAALGPCYPYPPFREVVSEALGTAEGTTVVRWRAGYETGKVPAPIRHAILLMVNLFDVCINVLLRDFEALHDGKQRPIFDLWAEVLDLANVEARGRQRLGSTEKPRLLSLLPAINEGLRDALAAVLPEINQMLVRMGWQDLAVTALNFAGLTYRDWGTPHLSRIDSREIGVDLTFRNTLVARPQAFLNEARLSALALAIYFADRKVCAATQQAETPRLIVLDDVLIGLDQSNRLPVIDVLADQFKDWQIILFTHDRVWFEMARAYQRRHKADKFWNYAKIHSDDDPTKAPVVSLVTSSAAADVIADGDKFLKQGQVNAAGNYARIAAELALREFCDTKKVLVAYQQLPDKTPASALLTAAKEFSTTKGSGTYDMPLAAVDMYTSILFNKLSHGGVPAVTSHEVQGALNTIDGLLFALKVVPTGTKAPVP